MLPERAGAASSVVTTVGYGGFLLGPIFVEMLAEVLSLRVTLGGIVIIGIVIAAFAGKFSGQLLTKEPSRQEG